MDSSITAGQEQILSFLREHFRLSPKEGNPIAGIPEQQLRNIIADYRVLSLQAHNQPSRLRTDNTQGDTLVSSGFQMQLPDPKLIRRSSLYFDKFYVDDPLVRLSRGHRDGEKAIGKLLSVPVGSDLRESVTSALAYMQELLPAVEEGYLEFLPMSVAFEPPKQLLVNASDCFFEDSLPSHIMNWFWQRAKVQRAEKTEEGHWVGLPEAADEPCRAIWISYEGHEDVTRIFFLVDQELKKTESPGRYKTRMFFPKGRPDESRFNTWYYQSVNQASADTYQRVAHDLFVAHEMEAKYLAPTSFVADLLRVSLLPKQRGVAAPDLLDSLLLRINLPVVESASTSHLMAMRRECQEELHSLRTFLREELDTLQDIEDPAASNRAVRHVEKHLTQELIPQVEQNVRKLKGELAIDGVVLLAELGAVIPTQGFSLALLPIVIHAGVRGIRACRQYIASIKKHPAYFLWRLTRQ